MASPSTAGAVSALAEWSFPKTHADVPAYKEDGKTPRGGPHVGPILAQWLNQERNGQLLRSLRFWSFVLTRGDRKGLRIRTGHEAIAISFTPATGTLGFGIAGDTIDYDRLMNAEYQDDLSIPDLQPVAPEQYTLGFEDTSATP